MSQNAADSANNLANGQARSPFAQIAKELQLELNYTNEVFDQLVDDILLTMRGRSDALDAKIKQAWIDRHTKTNQETGKKTTPIFVKGGPEISGTMLVGPPGHGKTSVNRAAARYAAELVGLKFVDNPDDSYKITENDFVFMSLEFAGVNSALQIKGIPYKKKVKLVADAEKAAAEKGTSVEVEYLAFLKDYSLSTLGQAGGGMLLLDDLLNATQEMINVALPLTEEKRFAGTHLGKHVYVGATGNLGARDGTKTSAMSSALAGRMRILMVRDNVQDIVKRMKAEFRGTGDKGIFGCMYFDVFVSLYGEKVTEDLPDGSERMGGYGSPRTLMKAMNAHFYELCRVGGNENAEDTLENFMTSTGAYLGPNIGKMLMSFMNSAFQFADPAARLLLTKGEIHPAFEKHTQAPNGPDAQDFFYQLANAIGEHAARMINSATVGEGGSDKDYEAFAKIVDNVAKGLRELDGAPYTLALDIFKDRVLATNPYLRVKGANEDRMSFNDKAYVIVREAFLIDCDAEKRKLLDPILSESNLYKNSIDLGAPREKSVRPDDLVPTPAKPARAKRSLNPSA